MGWDIPIPLTGSTTNKDIFLNFDVDKFRAYNNLLKLRSTTKYAFVPMYIFIIHIKGRR